MLAVLRCALRMPAGVRGVLLRGRWAVKKKKQQMQLNEAIRVLATAALDMFHVAARHPSPIETERRSALWCAKHPWGAYERFVWRDLAISYYQQSKENVS